MKKSKKFLVLIPVLGLFLSGCSFQEVKHSIGESWIGQHILHPIYDPIKNLINGDKKEEQKGGEQDKEEEQKQPEEETDPEGAFPSVKITSFFKKYGFEGATLPRYEIAAENGSFEESEHEEYAEYGIVAYYVYANNSTRDEMEAYAAALTSAGWTLEKDQFEDYEGELGETGLSVNLVDWTVEHDEDEDPYVTIAFVYEFEPESGGDVTVPTSATAIVEDLVKCAWGVVEDGDIADPDANGIVKCNYVDVLSSLEPTESEENLNGALTSFIGRTGFPQYLKVAQGPTYDSTFKESELFMMTTDEEFVVYLCAFVDEGDVCVSFECGPTSAYIAE